MGGLLLLGLACAPGEPGAPPPAQTSLRSQPPAVENPNRSLEGATVTFYGEGSGIGMALDRALSTRFTADTGIRVNHVPKPMSSTETYATYNRFFQARSTDVDCMMLDIIWPGAFADHLLDLEPWFSQVKGRHLDEIIRNNTVDGRLVAMPEFGDVGLLYYRTDLLEKYGFSGPPRTWQDLERMARTIQEGERPENPNFYGFVWQGYTYEGLTCNALEWQYSSGGGRILDPDTGAIQVSDPRALEAFSRAAGWIGTISPAGVTSYMEEEGRNLFQTGNAAFLRSWPYVFALVSGEGSKVAGRFGVTFPPRDGRAGGRHAATLGGWQVGVSRYSRNPEAAVEFVRYWTSADAQAWRATEGSYLPTMPEVYKRPEVARAQALYRVIPEVLPYAVARPSSVTRDLYNEVSSIYAQGVAEILQGGEPRFAAARMERDLRSAMDYLQEQETP